MEWWRRGGMVDIAYLLASVGHPEEVLARRETVANELVPAGDSVSLVRPESGPESVESTVEDEWAATVVLESLARNEAAYDAFFVGCFGEPGLAALRELTDKPVVGSASSTLHTAAQLGDRFSVVTILESTEPMVHRQVQAMGLTDQLASVRVVHAPVLDIDHDADALVEDMVEAGTRAVEDDGADTVVPGCMTLAFLQVHEEIAAELGVPFLDPARVGLGTAALWARWGIAQSPAAYPPADRSKLGGLLPTESG